ncbi:hypothetical protein TDMWS_05750 [Thermodesulfomicrobium sp. WS]|uniref:tetratricopeptide repeat protein n=1 Tax=Thermodesulfomicrobium sp. WS TaxID=3004129 RepID=UPI0024924ECE|nr:tetratricopeptide repeat protein [Thermodesulfomicrobium sp. WS]BDV00490.1 hypothetical protein TDMWS_05750 [Thermodesulfomicrobium sp. WS]
MPAVCSRILLIALLILASCAHMGSGSREVSLRLDLAEAYIANRKPQLAMQELMAIADRAEGLKRYHFDLGLAYFALDQVDDARKAFARTVELDPEYGEGWNNLGRVLEAQGKWEEAKAAYEKAIAILTYATPELAATNLARLLLRHGQADQAEAMARLAIRRNWLYTPGYLLLAQIQEGKGGLAAAQATLEEGLAANLNAVALKLALGENILRQGKTAEAKAQFHAIVKNHPGTPEAKVAQDYLDILPEGK